MIVDNIFKELIKMAKKFKGISLSEMTSVGLMFVLLGVTLGVGALLNNYKRF